MRTKHLLWALALPAVFAACTNDDFESIAQGNDALQGRPMAGNVKLNFDFGEADTRLNSDFQFEVGDQIGATLMDEYEEDGESSYNIMGLPASGNVYSFVDYIQTNYRYTNTESGWTNSNLLCSGNYFFYYPYMPTLNTRVAFEKYLNPNQVLEANTSAAARKMINDNQMYIGYKLVEGATEGSTQVLNVSMSPVFAFPYFEIMCTDSEPVTIQKIALQYIDKTKDMPLMAIVDPTNSSRATTIIGGVQYVDFEKDPTSAVRMGNPATDKPQLDKDAVIAARQIQVTFPEGTTTKNGSPVRTYMVIPSGDYSGNDAVELLIYTDKGLVTADLSVAHENTGTTGGQNNVTNDVAMGEVSGTMDKVRTIKITFDEVAINNPDEFTTTSTQDLDTYVSWSAQIGGTKNMWIKSTNKDTELSAAAVATLAKNQNITMNILGDITIAEDVKSEDYNAAKINFLGGKVSTSYAYGNDGKITGLSDLATNKGQTIYNKATLTIPSNIVDPTDGDLTFHNKGNITLTGTSYGIKFVNEGTMTINAGTNRSTTLAMSNESDKQDHLENYGTLNINGNVVADNTATTNNGWINNYANATVNIAQGATITARIDNEKDNAEGCEYGKIVVNGTWNIFGNSGKNEGLIEVNGTLRVPETGAKYENAEAWAYPLNGTYTPTIKNNGNVMKVTNNGLVELSANSAYSTSGITGAKGRVDNTNISTRATISEDETIFVKVTAAADAKELNDKLQNASAELVVFENAGSLTLDAADLAEGVTTFELVIPSIEVYGNLNITTPAGYTLNVHAVSGGTHFDVINGTTKITARSRIDLGTQRAGAYVDVAEGALLEVENNAELTSSCDLQFTGDGLVGNYGAITNVKAGTQAPNLVEGSRNVVYKN